MRLKVGEFSRLCQVPVKTLRYYDEVDLFKPAEIDRFTSYRYYTLEQLAHIHRIMALKELGLSLEDIGDVLHEQLSTHQIQQMLLRKESEVEQRIEDELARLSLVKFHLRQLEAEASLPELQIVIKRIDPFPALTLRNTFPTQKDIDATGIEIQKAVAADVLKPIALPMGIAYVDEFRRDDLDYEFVLPLPADVTSSDAVSLESRGVLRVRQVDSMEMAATYLHQGDYDGLLDSQLSLQRWIIANGYTLGSEMRMIYFRGPMHGVAPSEYLTELQHHVERR